MKNVIDICVDEYLSGKGTLTEISRLNSVKRGDIIEKLAELGYVVKKGCTLKSVIGLKKATEEYISNINNKPSLTKISSKYGIKRQTLSNRLKELGYEIINYQNISKFDENIFDEIDTEEKAYWLGFIYADGYINSKSNCFEISLKASDSDHLQKFNQFMKYNGDNVKIESAKCNDTVCYRARWYITNKHLWNTLNNYGCVPNKSLILTFPKTDIFKSKDLIRHFIRGYIDGDGCISYSNKEHTRMTLSILGTFDFLNSLQEFLPCNEHTLHEKNNVCCLCINGHTGYNVVKYLYENSNIYLSRKYDRYLEFCRLYEESYKELSGNIGEGCDANTELISEISKGSEIM